MSLPAHQAKIVLEIEWKWGGVKTEVILSAITFQATLRIGFAKFVDRWPGFGSINVCFTKRPEIDFDLQPLGDNFPDTPFVTVMLIDIIRNGIGGSMVWPKQIVVDFLGPAPTPDDDIEGVLGVTVVRAKDLTSGSSILGAS